MTIRILLVDDHTLFRSGLKALLSRQSDFEVVGEAADGLEGVKLAEQLKPDLVLLDLDMPVMRGTEALAQMLENDKTIMYNYIKFMATKIRFLNEKIMYFTAGSTERRLALYLASFGKKTIKTTISMTDLANTLDVGRASLYRAFDKLSEDGYIIRSEKIILLLNREEMINHYQ